jgi:hypothetical protein
MVFHGDYEVDYEIYQRRENDWRIDYLGHIPAFTAQEALRRWADQNNLTSEELQKIEAVVPKHYGQI